MIETANNLAKINNLLFSEVSTLTRKLNCLIVEDVAGVKWTTIEHHLDEMTTLVNSVMPLVRVTQ